MIQFQKYRDGELPKDITIINWSVNDGNIKELPDYEWPDF